MIKQFCIIFGCLAVGEIFVHFTGLKLPSSIIGMLLLTTCLHFKIIKLEWVKPLADILVGNMAFFFVPPGVALMCYFDIIAAQFWPILIATVLSTVLVIAATGWTHHLVAWLCGVRGNKNDGKSEEV